MTFPGHEHDNPQQVSTAVHTAGFAQDVVMATSRLIHGQDLTDRDREALRSCRELLSRMLSTDITFVRSGERQLDGANTVALLRKARSARPQDAGDLASTVEAIDQLLAGRHDNEYVEEISRLRDIFLIVGEVNLAAMTRHDSGREVADSWISSIANSTS